MRLQGRNLTLNMKGPDVDLLQKELRILRHVIPQDEPHFGRATRLAVMTIQQVARIEATGIVDERTATLINKLVDELQHAPGTVAGTVTGEPGGPLNGARVGVLGTNIATLTNAQGQYKLDNVAAGSVRIQASAIGYQPQDASIVVAPGQSTVRNFALTKVATAQQVVRGRVAQENGTVVPNAKVVAFQVAGADSQRLNETTSEPDGRYEIKYTPATTPAMPVNLRVKAYDDSREIGDSGIRKNVAPDQSGIDVVVAAPGAVDFGVKGIVARADGTPMAGVTVRAFDRDLRSEQQLGEAKTDATGRYEIRWDKAQFGGAERGRADLVVRAFDAAGKLLAASPAWFNAPVTAEVDLTLAVPAEGAATLFEKLGDVLNPLLDGVKVVDLEEDDKHQDLSFLASETGLGQDVLGRFALAHRLAGQALQPEFWFALLGAGFLPGTPEQSVSERVGSVLNALPSVGAAAVRKALNRGFNEREIPDALRDKVAAWTEEFLRFAGRRIVGNGGAPTFVKSALQHAGIQDAQKQERFGRLLSEHQPFSPAFVDALKKDPTFKEAEVADLHTSFRLAELTQGDFSVVKVVKEAFGVRKPEQIRSLATKSEKEWVQLVEAKHAAGEIELPFAPDVTESVRFPAATVYGQTLERQFREAFPTAAFAGSLKRAVQEGRVKGLRHADKLTQVLQRHDDFELLTTRIDDFLDNRIHPDLQNIAKDPNFRHELKAVQRVFKLAPTFEATDALLADGVHSARQIYRMGESRFVRRYGNRPGFTPATAHLAWNRAADTHAAVLTVVADLKALERDSQPRALRSARLAMAGFPDWNNLFQTGDLCECEHCNSVLGPGAYFADLLMFLKDRAAANPARMVKDILFDRRPDLGYLELNCANALTPLPYVDVVGEVLEAVVAAGANDVELAGFTAMPADPAAAKTAVGTALRNANLTIAADFALSRVAPADPNRWVAHGDDVTYLLKKKTTANFFAEVLRNTKASAAELRAYPQYVNPEAYKKLREARFPFSLPFDLFAEEVRAGFRKSNLQRWDLMRTLRGPAAPNNPTDGDIAAECFDISVDPGATIDEKRLILAALPADLAQQTIWGEHGNVTWLNTVSNVRTFLHKTSLEFNELLALLDLKFINPTGDIFIEHTDPSCDTAQKNIRGLNGAKLDRVHRFLRLWRKLKTWKMWELDLALESFGGNPPVLDEAFLVRLFRFSEVKRKLGGKVTVEQALALFGNLPTRTHFTKLHEPREDALYQTLFLNKRLGQPLDLAFAVDRVNVAPPTVEKISGHQSVVLAALGIKETDLAVLKGLTKASNSTAYITDDLTLSNLSFLWRHAWLCKVLKFKPAEWKVVLKTVNADLMAFPDPNAAWDFLETISQLRASGFTPDQLNWLLSADRSAQAAVKEADAARALAALRKELQAIAATSSITPPTDIDSLVALLTSLLQTLNRDEAATQVFLATLRNDLSQAVPVAGLPASFDFPNGIKNSIPIRYDEPAGMLRFTGLMTAADRTTLLTDTTIPAAVRGLAAYQTAVNALFDVPRLALKFFEPAFTAPLATLPSAVDFGALVDRTLTTKISYDLERRVLRFSGLMTADEKTALDALSANASYRTAVASLFNQPRNIAPPDSSVWLTDADLVFPLADKLSTNLATAVTKAQAYLARTLSQRAVVQYVGTQLGLTAAVAEFLLTRYNRLPDTLLAHLTGVFAGTTGVVDYATLKTTFDAWFWAHRVATMWKKWKVTLAELEKLLSLTVGGQLLDVLTLPLDSVGAVPSLERFLRSSRLIRLRDTLPETQVTLLEVLEKLSAGAYAGAADFAADVERLNEAWLAQDVSALTASLDLVYPNAYLKVESWERLRRATYFLESLNAGTATVKGFAAATMTTDHAKMLKGLLRSKFGTETWLSLSGEIQDALRERKRDALAAYLLSTSAQPDAPTGKWENTNDLYAYYLVDVEMCACQLTSRLVQGSGSIQLFVQRCFMGLEPKVEVKADGDTGDSAWRWWAWMRKYRVWEANRKVFLWPENWIEPELKRDRSPFFKDLENELLQNEINPHTVETAYQTYLEKLDAVAQLEIASFYQEDDGQEAMLHVFGRSPGAEPHAYYYRRYDYRQWTPWEKVDLDIQSDYLIPSVVDRRLFLFWPVLTEVADEAANDSVKVPKAPGANDSQFTPDKTRKRLRLQLAVSEYRDGKWSAKRVTTDAAETTGYRGAVNTKHYGFYAMDRSDIDGRFGIQYEGGVQAQVYGAFQLSACKGVATITSRFGNPGLVTGPEASSGPEYLKYHEMTNRYDYPQNDLTLVNGWFDTDSPPPPFTPVLDETPGRFGVRLGWHFSYFDKLWVNGNLIRGHSWAAEAATPVGIWLPLFYNDQKRTFMVIPAVRLPSVFPPGSQDQPSDALVSYPKIKHYFRQWQVAADAFFQTLVDALNLGQLSTDQRTEMEQNLYRHFPEMAPPKYTDAQVRDLVKRLYMRYFDAFLGRWALNLFQQSRQLHFKNFYHPFVCEFGNLVSNPLAGIPALMSRQNQLRNSGFSFQQTYKPTANVIQAPIDPREADAYPDEVVDFSPDGAYAPYNWELFFHAPLLIANQLSKNQRFEQARDWYHFIFNPLGVESPMPGGSVTSKYWITKPFFETTDPQYVQQRIDNILLMLAGDTSVPGYSAQAKQELENQVRDWRNNPFEPHRIANYRTVAYQKTVVMKYLDNLIAWGDNLFGQDSMESINEATQLYVLAAEILGSRPRKVPPRAKPPLETFNELEDELDKFSNALVEVENLVPQPQGGNGNSGNAPPLPVLYFAIPQNDKLLGYWDTVADRLYKIRHCMNIEGVVRQLALFEPAIDPAALVKAVAGGVDIGAALADLSAPLPPYRFSILVQKANEVCNDLRALGASLLAALEKKDAEALALLRQGQEILVLEAVKKILETQIAEAKENLAAAQQGKELAETKKKYYESREFMNVGEAVSLALSSTSLLIDAGVAVGYALAGGLKVVPQFIIGAAGFGGSPHATAETGGKTFGEIAEDAALTLNAISNALSKGSALASTLAGYQRRQDDWTFQQDLAAKEIDQSKKSIAAAELRLAAAEQQLEKHVLDTENAKATDAFMRSKYTNQELYQWQIGQISGVYFQSYKLAYDLAKRAERCFRFELGLPNSNYISFGYWDSLKKGLMSGERLQYDLRRLEAAHLEQNRREFELTKHASLALLDPLALVKLRETGRCFIQLPEESFDLDYPGHYYRRIKSVSLTLPCVVGPFTTVSCTLRLLKNSVRINTANGDDGYRRNTDSDGLPAEDERFVESNVPVKACAASSGQNDSGIFELSFRDERYLPFEGAGVMSEWVLELFTDLPSNNPVPASPDYGEPLRQFDYESIADVVLHVKYTAREDAGAFKNRVIGHLREHFAADGAAPSLRMFNLRQEFPSQWHRFLKPENPANGNVFEWDVTTSLFPFKDAHKTLTINSMWLLARCTDEQIYNVQFTPAAPGAASAFALKQVSDYRGLHLADHDSSGDNIEITQTAAKWSLKMTRPGGGNLAEDPVKKTMEVEDVVLVVGYSAPNGEA
jgi:hypothetical protein